MTMVLHLALCCFYSIYTYIHVILQCLIEALRFIELAENGTDPATIDASEGM
jgi:hypothetical protein